MVDRTGLRLIDRFVRIGRIDCFDFVDKSNEFIASKICGNFLFLFFFFFQIDYHSQKSSVNVLGGTLVRSNVDLFHLLDHKESIRIKNISFIENVSIVFFLNKFIYTKVDIYVYFFVFHFRIIREIYNFVKLFLIKPIENYLTNNP